MKCDLAIYIYTYIELVGRLIPKVLDYGRGAVIEFFKQRKYCFPKQIVSGRSLLQWGMKKSTIQFTYTHICQLNSHICELNCRFFHPPLKKAPARNNLFGKTVVSLFKELYIHIYNEVKGDG